MTTYNDMKTKLFVCVLSEELIDLVLENTVLFNVSYKVSKGFGRTMYGSKLQKIWMRIEIKRIYILPA